MSIEKFPQWLEQESHVRYNPLTGEQVLVSPWRLQRAWAGKATAELPVEAPEFAADCPFCPGNQRAGGGVSPVDAAAYPYTFINDTAALSFADPTAEAVPYADAEAIFQAHRVQGRCEVIVHDPRHHLTLATLPLHTARAVFDLWAQRSRVLSELPGIRYINIFENYLFGASMRHPHNQIWAISEVSVRQQRIQHNLSEYHRRHGRHLIEVIAAAELAREERVIYSNNYFVALVPFWAEWPFEVMVLPRRAQRSLADLDAPALEAFTDIYRQVIFRFNQLFSAECPYSASLYQAPVGHNSGDGAMYLMFRPPVLRDINTYKWMVGFEMMSMPQRDLTPETAAALLRGDGWS